MLSNFSTIYSTIVSTNDAFGVSEIESKLRPGTEIVKGYLDVNTTILGNQPN